jgi:hypothetical protein
MATMEINVPVEIVEAGIQNVYGLEYPIELLDVVLDELSGDLVMNVYIDDEEFTEITPGDILDAVPYTDTWTVTTTADFTKGIL